MSEIPARLSWTEFVYELAALTQKMPNLPPLFLVGGAVRDAYLRRPPKAELDIAVDGDAIDVARFVTDAMNGDIYIMDRERDVARVFVKRDGNTIIVDFARFRGETLEADLRDRDFTMNALAADLLGDQALLIDPLGGIADLRAKVLRRCSPQAIANDPIRALRAIRLSAQFGLKIQPDTALDIRRHAAALRRSSPERIRDEFFKLLGLEQAARALRVAAHVGLLEQVLAVDISELDLALSVVDRLSVILTAISSKRTDHTAASFDLGMLIIQFDRYRAKLQAHLAQVYGNGRSHAELLTLAALLRQHGDALDRQGGPSSLDHARSLAELLRLTKDEARKLFLAVKHCRAVIERESWTKLDIHRYWFQLGPSGIDVVLLGAAIVLGSAGSRLKQAEWLKLVERSTDLLDAYFNRYGEIVEPPLLLDGNDVQAALGIAPGPQVGRLLALLREAQVTGEVASADAAREFVLRSARKLAD